jgi:hypothetical protein
LTRVLIDTDDKLDAQFLPQFLHTLDAHCLPDCRLIYSDASFRSSLIFSLLPESYTDVLGAMLGSLLHPSPPVCAALATLATPLSPTLPKLHEDCVSAHAACAGGTGEQGWYVGMHVRQSGLWDPTGSSPGGLFALRTAGNCPVLHPPFDRHPLRPFPWRWCVCVRARVRACVRACACVHVCLFA